MLARVQQAIVTRLELLLPDTIRVMTADDLAGVTEEQMPTPAVHVIYQGEKVIENRPDGRSARTADNWLIVAVVSNQRRGDRDEATEAATGLVDQLRPGLMGWQPISANGPMMLASAPAPGATSVCYYLPTAFTVETIVHANH